jgi:hypothetical protein
MLASGVPNKFFMKPELMVWNLYYATLMARAKYLTKPEPLPNHHDALGMAEYYKEHYNTYLGATTVDKAREVFKDIILKFDYTG